MSRRAGIVVCLAVACGIAPASSAQDASIDAPSVVPISARLVTSGQPTTEALAGLGAQGFEAVISLAPLTARGAARREAAIVGRQGLAYVALPISFDDPKESDFDAFVRAMAKFRDRKVLVHCRVNMRASTMVFLYRVVVLKERPEVAYEAVAQVWSPVGPWKRLIVEVLRKNGIAFEPY
jgi:protein tyrosine phosphatase (PTP) superfamily phosphohydrolase (DUF442 family)